MLAQRPIILTKFTSTRTAIIKNHPIFPRINNSKLFEFRTSNLVSSCEIISLVRSPNTRRRGLFLSSAFWGNGEDEAFEILENEEEEEGLVGSSPGFYTNRSALARIDYVLNRLSKWLVMVLFWVVIFSKPEARSLWAIVGNFTNLHISTTLKHLLNQERPVPGLRTDPGMPSSHAQSFFFTIPFAVMSLVEHLGVNGLSLTVSGFAMTFASYLSWLRVSHRLHTTSQVVAGAVLGISFCIFWFWWWEAMVRKAFFSHLWVRLLVILGVVVLCSIFVVYIVQTVLGIKRKLDKSD